MAAIQRINVGWVGLTGLPGVSVMFGDDGSTANADIKAFFNAIKALFPAPLAWQIPAGGDLIDPLTGFLTGTWSNAAGGGSVAATGSGNYAAGVGAYVNWGTNVIENHRRLKGRTFLAPMFNSAYDSAGTINDTFLATLQTAATAVVTAGHLMVWHRPTALPGSAATVESAVVPDQVTSLKSRRR